MLIEHEIETVPYACRRCGRSWSSRYEVTRWEDGLGDAYEVSRVGGAASPPPRLGPLCPFCGGPPASVYSVARGRAETGMSEPPRPPRSATRAGAGGGARSVAAGGSGRPRPVQLRPRTRRFP